MKKCLAALGAIVFAFLIAPGRCGAETRTISWNAVTTYTDGTPYGTVGSESCLN